MVRSITSTLDATDSEPAPLLEIYSTLESFAPIAALRFSRWAYAALNATHVLAIALLVGGAMPLSLRLFGFWPMVARAGIVRVLAVTAGAGLGLGLLSGALLFATRASEYAVNPAFQIKLVLILIGASSAVLAHWHHGRDLSGASETTARRIALISCVCWIGALLSGRLIAFVHS